jgi:hypothetical protein
MNIEELSDFLTPAKSIPTLRQAVDKDSWNSTITVRCPHCNAIRRWMDMSDNRCNRKGICMEEIPWNTVIER